MLLGACMWGGEGKIEVLVFINRNRETFEGEYESSYFTTESEDLQGI